MAVKLFLCHHSADSADCGKLLNNLRPAQRNNTITLWTPHHLTPGEDVPKYVATHLEDTDLILLLLTPDFIGSDYFWSTELAAAVERHRSGRARMVPIILRSCTWEEFLPTHGLVPIPADKQPLVTAPQHLADERIAHAAREILSLARSIPTDTRRQSARSTPISEINAQLKQSRVDDDMPKLMALKRSLRYGDGDGDPYKATKKMPLDQLNHLLAACRKELLQSKSPIAKQDWRDDRIAELETLVAALQWQVRTNESAGFAHNIANSDTAILSTTLPVATPALPKGTTGSTLPIPRAPPTNNAATLTLDTAEGAQSIQLRPHNSLGRHPENTIQLLDKIVSKMHCTIRYVRPRWLLHDLNSSNGTFLNSERIPPESDIELNDQDELAIGSTRGRFTLPIDESGPTVHLGESG